MYDQHISWCATQFKKYGPTPDNRLFNFGKALKSFKLLFVLCKSFHKELDNFVIVVICRILLKKTGLP